MAELAPVEYVVIGFPENRFTGEIAPALVDLVERGVVRVLDLVFVMKDAVGAITTFEYDELDELAAFAEIEGEADGMISEHDVVSLAESLAPDSAALFLLWEDLWAADLARALRSAGGELLDGGRIPHALVQSVLTDVETEATV